MRDINYDGISFLVSAYRPHDQCQQEKAGKKRLFNSAGNQLVCQQALVVSLSYHQDNMSV